MCHLRIELKRTQIQMKNLKLFCWVAKVKVIGRRKKEKEKNWEKKKNQRILRYREYLNSLQFIY